MFRSLGYNIFKGGKWLIESLTLKTDSSLKDERIDNMSDGKLLAKRASARMSVSSSVTGVILNTTLAAACPIFAGSAVINLWQLGVSLSNRHRAKEEISKRRTTKTGLEKEQFETIVNENDHRARDILLGCTMKTACTVMALGIVGFDNVLDNFAAHAASSAMGPDLANPSSWDHGVSTSAAGTELTEGHLHTAEEFKEAHPHIGGADLALHNAVNQPGDIILKDMAQLSHMDLTSETAWPEVYSSILNRADWLKALSMLLFDGATVEIISIFTADQIIVDETLQSHVEKEVKKWERNFKFEYAKNPGRAKCESLRLVLQNCQNNAKVTSYARFKRLHVE